MIIVCAPDNSGQHHAAELVKTIRRTYPHETFLGIGGRELADAGCELVHDITDSSAMLAGVVGALRWAVPAYRQLVARMDRDHVKLVIHVDSPTFNLPLARAAKRRGIKTFYYIAPQVWAWARFRIRRIRKRVDRLAVILPFEENYFRAHGLDVHFVGHPFIHQIRQTPPDADRADELAAVASPKILIMPGSRRHLIQHLLPQQLTILRLLTERIGPVRPFIVAWPALSDQICRIVADHSLHPRINGIPDRDDQIGVWTEHKPALIAAADLALAASGTGTLEVAWHGRPMIIMYTASPVIYQLFARWVIHARHLSLINILAQRELVREFMPYIRDPNEVAAAAEQLLADPARAEALGRELKHLTDGLLGPCDPAERAAELAIDLIDET